MVLCRIALYRYLVGIEVRTPSRVAVVTVKSFFCVGCLVLAVLGVVGIGQVSLTDD